MTDEALTPQRAARHQLRLSLAQVDRLTGIGSARLSLLERLPPERLSAAIRQRLATAYGISEAELVGAPKPPDPEPSF